MNNPTTSLLARCTLWMGALFTATSLYAGPAEDYAKANEALKVGDLPVGMGLLRKAADANHPKAQAQLGDLLRAADYNERAVELYRKAAEQGEPAGEYGLAGAYAEGVGVKKDPALALEWYRKAEKKDYAPAVDALARAYRSGTLGLPKDPEQAAKYGQRARELMIAAGVTPPPEEVAAPAPQPTGRKARR